MSQTQENSPEFSQQAIYARIKALKLEEPAESIRVSGHEQNASALAPISSLPPEIFAVIFSFLCSSEKPGDNLTRIRLSHVCHQWREITLNQSFLWNHLDFTTLSSAGAIGSLARAKLAPLYLEARISSQRWNHDRFNTFRKELRACVPRTRHLSITAKCAHIRSTLQALGSPAPTLENLSLFSTTEFYMAIVPIPDTLFDGFAPRLSCLKLHHCSINWKWPPLKGLKYLEILGPAANSRPKLAVWLDALAEMIELKTLTLHHASPEAPYLPFDVERTVTLLSLTHFKILASLKDCVFALAHLDLPALTQLTLEANYYMFPFRDDVQELLPYVARYAHGTQHSQPLQSMLIRNNRKCVDLLAWPVPDIGLEVQNPPTLLSAKLPTCLAFSFRCHRIFDSHYYSHLELLEWLMTGLALDGIVTLAAQDLCSRARNRRNLDLPVKQFWLHISPTFPQLRCVRLSPPTMGGFMEMLLEDSERPLLPSLRELIVVDATESDLRLLPLCDALMKRVEQGVPLEVLDLRMCFPGHNQHDYRAQFRRLSEVVVDVQGPESDEANHHMRTLWKAVPLGIFLDDDDRENIESDTDSDTESEEESDEE